MLTSQCVTKLSPVAKARNNERTLTHLPNYVQNTSTMVTSTSISMMPSIRVLDPRVHVQV